LAGDDQQVFAMSAAAAAARSEPWVSFFEPAELASHLKELGFARVEHFSPADANVRYFAGRSDGLRDPGHEHVMLAKVG
jgi:O-methyltransferase involved in polyketide biosynthesis